MIPPPSAQAPHTRVLFVDQTSALGGAELSLLDIVKQRGARDRVVLFQPGELEHLLRGLGTEVVVSQHAAKQLNVRKNSGLWGALSAGRFLRHHVQAVRAAAADCQVLYANTPKAFIVSALAARLAGKPVIYHLRDIVSPDHFSWFNRQALVRLARWSRATVIANSLATAQAFIAAGVDQSAISIIYNGIDAEEFERARQQRGQIRERIRASLKKPLPAGCKLIGVFGRLAQWKGQDVALRALAQLPDVHMLLVGSALFGEDDFVDQLNALVIKLDLSSRVHFLGFRKDVADIMQASDVVVHCSSSPEPFGRVIVEAMLSQRPIVAARAGGATEIIHEQQTGLLFEPGNTEDLARCIAQLLSEDHSCMIQTGYRDAQQRFSVTTQVQQVSEFIERVRATPRSQRTLPTRPDFGKPTRVLYVDQTAQLGGAELCLLDMLKVRQAQLGSTSDADRVLLLQQGPLVEQLRQQQIDVQVESLGTAGQSLHKDSGPLRKLWGSTDVLRLVRRTARQARDRDVIYANTPKALVVAALAGVLAGKPVIYHLHDILSRAHFSRSNIWLLVGLTNRCVRHVIANSLATQQAFREVGGQTPVTVCYNGFEAGLFELSEARRVSARQTIRRELGLDEPTRLIGVFGRLAPWKGQHVALAALKQLPSVHLALVGDALFGEDVYKRELVAQASAEGLKERVHLLGFRSDIPELMQAVDVVVHSSIAPEPFGRVIVEAMLSRRPVVASRAGGVKEILMDGDSGWLAEPGDAYSLAECVRRWLTDDQRREQMVEAAYTRALQTFELRSVVSQVEAVLRGVKEL